LADTYFALASLNLVGSLSPDEDTLAFLRSRQKRDGSYESIFQAFFAIGGLRLLNAPPLFDPRDYLIAHTRTYDISLLPPGSASIFAQLYHLTKLHRWLEVNLPPEKKRDLLSFVTSHQRGDGGFGHARSTLMETRDAVFILQYLGALVDLQKIYRFLRHCEDEGHGFVNLPGNQFSYLEHIHAGLELSGLLSAPPTYPKVIRDFLLACRRINGGYARTTHTGIATLENTYLALASFQLLSSLLS